MSFQYKWSNWEYRYWPIVGIVNFGTFLCIGTTLANLNGLGNSALGMLRLKNCVTAGAINGAAIFKNLALIWSDPVDLDISKWISWL